MKTIERAKSALGGVTRLLGSVVSGLRERRRSAGSRPARSEWHPPVVHADERTIRRIAEAQAGGISSQESAARYERGENPGGLHHKAPLPPEAELDPTGSEAVDAETRAKDELDEELQPGQRDDARARISGRARIGRQSPPYQRRGA